MKLKPRHHELIDLELLNPRLKARDLAAASGFSEKYISRLRSSDAYQAALAARRADLSAQIRDAVFLRTARVAEKSLAEIDHRLGEAPEAIPLSELRDTAAVALRGLGFGNARSPAPVAQTTNILVAHPADLAAARERIRAMSAANSEDQPDAPARDLSAPA